MSIMINLIYNKDLEKLNLSHLTSAKESDIQKYCHLLFNNVAYQYELKFGKKAN